VSPDEQAELPTLSAQPAPVELSYEESGDMGPLWAALAKAQGEFEVIETTREVEYSGRRFRYAELGEILAKTRKALVANGLCLIQPFHGFGPGKVLMTKIGHSSGAHIAVKVQLPEAGNPQQLGSLLTYIKRYSVSSLLALASEDDDDGNAASGTPKQTQPKAPPRDRPPNEQPKGGSMSKPLKEQIMKLSREAGLSFAELKAFASQRDIDLETADDAGGKVVLDALTDLKVKR
jgi:hypothetical protein